MINAINIPTILLDMDDDAKNGICLIFDDRHTLIAIQEEEIEGFHNYWFCDLLDDLSVAVNNNMIEKYPHFKDMLQQCITFITTQNKGKRDE